MKFPARLLAGLALAVWIAAPRADAAPLRVAYSSISGAMLPLWVAKERKLFDKYGLEVELAYIRGVAIEALLTGEVQFVRASPPAVVRSTLRGAELAIIANTINVAVFSLMTRPEIRRPEDLKGKKIATSPPGSAAALIDRIILTRLGLDPDRDVTLIPFGTSAGRNFGQGGLARLDALIEGEISATAVTTEGLLELEKSGLDKTFRVLTDNQKLNVYTGGGGDYAFSRVFLKESRSQAKAFLKSICEAIAMARKHQAKAKETLSKTMRIMVPDLLDFTYRIYTQTVIPERPYVRPESIETAISIIASRNDAEERPIADLIDSSLIRELEGEGLFEEFYR